MHMFGCFGKTMDIDLLFEWRGSSDSKLIRDPRILLHSEQHGLRFARVPEHEHRRAGGKSGCWSDRLSTCAKCWTSLEAVCTMQHDQGETREQAAALGQVDHPLQATPRFPVKLAGRRRRRRTRAPSSKQHLRRSPFLLFFCFLFLVTKVSFLACVAKSPTILKCFTSTPKHTSLLS